MRRALFALLLMGVVIAPATAQQPALSDVLADARRAAATARVVLERTPEYQAYQAALAVQRALEQMAIAEAAKAAEAKAAAENKK